jgi:hypothetical protein
MTYGSAFLLENCSNVQVSGSEEVMNSSFRAREILDSAFGPASVSRDLENQNLPTYYAIIQ